MNKAELVAELASRMGSTKADALNALDSLSEVVAEALVRGDKVQLVGLGTWSVRQRKERNGVNPSNGTKIKIPAKKVAAFKASSTLAKRVA